ncbi:MAG: YHYH protein, partial [Nitrosotalea sp.]
MKTLLLIAICVAITCTMFNVYANGQSYSIPSWVKNNAKLWSDGQISDNDFTSGIQYLMQKQIIQVPQQNQSSSNQQIPSWIKSDAGLWSSGNISNDGFVKDIQYLMQNGILSYIQFNVNYHAANATDTINKVTSNSQIILTDDELSTIAGNKYPDGNVMLGDGKYVTTGPEKGYIYLCHVPPNGSGAQGTGPWIHGNTWNFLEKLSVSGSVSWPNAVFSDIVSGDTRTLSGNDLPVGNTTGVFPISSSDPISAYDRNPNSISLQSFSDKIPANPTYSDTPYCMGGEVGIMLTGVPLFDGFDAELRDAQAYEAQDSCNGHPQVSGEYHYHGLSSCLKNIDEKSVLGYALDGFPITGPKIATNKYLTTDDLDECHGITSTIIENGVLTTTYHYVMTYDFPYSAS